jgi:hypothetical protein
VAERIDAAFRSFEEVAKIEHCPREESFRQMIANIGNRKAQDKIRMQTPKGQHCAFLIADEHACDKLPVHADVPEASVGLACPNNPRPKPQFAHLYEAACESVFLFSEAVRCRDMIELNVVPPLDAIDPTTFQICRTVKENMLSAEHNQRMRAIESFMGVIGIAR